MELILTWRKNFQSRGQNVFDIDLGEELPVKVANDIDIGIMKLYADDIAIFGESPGELQNTLELLEYYCSRRKLTVYSSKTKTFAFKDAVDYQQIYGLHITALRFYL